MCNININTICINSAKLKIICLIGKWELPSLKMEEVPMIKFMNFCNISVRWRSRYGVWPIAIPCLLLVLIIYHMLLPFYVFLLHYHDQLRIGAWSAQLSQTIALICPPPLFHLVHAIAPPFHLYLLFFSLKLLIQNFTLMKKKFNDVFTLIFWLFHIINRSYMHSSLKSHFDRRWF